MIELKKKDIKKVTTMLSGFPKEIKKVSVRAINHVTQTSSTAVAKELAKHVYVKQKDIKKTFSIRKATYKTLSSEVVSIGQPISLFLFKVNNRTPNSRKPVRVAVKRGGGMKYLGRKTFTATMSNGHVGIFQRKTESAYPIKKCYGPSVPSMLKTNEIASTIEIEARRRLKDRLDHEIDRVLSKKNK